MTLSCAKTDCADSNRHMREKNRYYDSEKSSSVQSVREKKNGYGN